MNNVIKEAGKVEIQLSREFYSENALIRSAEAFSNGFDVEVETKENKFEIKLNPKKDVDLEKAGNQFLNYVLSEMKNSSKVNI